MPDPLTTMQQLHLPETAEVRYNDEVLDHAQLKITMPDDDLRSLWGKIGQQLETQTED